MTAALKIYSPNKLHKLKTQFAPLGFDDQILDKVAQFMEDYKNGLEQIQARDPVSACSIYNQLLKKYNLQQPVQEKFKEIRQIIDRFVDQNLLMIMDAQKLAAFHDQNLEGFLNDISPVTRKFSKAAKTLLAIEIADRVIAFNYESSVKIDQKTRGTHLLASRDELTRSALLSDSVNIYAVTASSDAPDDLDID